MSGPDDEDIMALDPGDIVDVTLEDGTEITVQVPDRPYATKETPVRTGSGQAKVTLVLDGALDMFYGSELVMTAYHWDKNPERQRPETVIQSYRSMYGDMVDRTDRVSVEEVSVHGES